MALHIHKTEKILLLLAMQILLLAGCNSSRDLGNKPITGDVSGTIPEDLNGLDSNATWQGGDMRLNMSPASLKANSTDEATVTVRLFDDSHNPVVGKVIRFASTLGIITAVDTTDEDGIAQALFTSEPINAEAWVVASYTDDLDQIVRVGHRLSISGIELTLTPQTSDALVNAAVPVSLELLDASGDPLSDQSIVVTGSVSTTLQTNGSGHATLTLNASLEEVQSITATALGATTSTTVHFWTKIPTGTIPLSASVRNMRLFSSRTQLRADNSDEAVVTAILLNEKSNPAVGDTVYFEANIGIIDAFGIVDSSGRATVSLRSTAVMGVCVVQASAQGGKVTDSISVAFTGLSLQLHSDVNSARVGSFETITAKMLDASNNPIGGDPVIFQVTGGTFSDGSNQKSTTLDGNGVASIDITASEAGSVQVIATALNASDSIRLTFTQENLTLTAAREWVAVGGLDSVLVSATYIDAQGQPIVGGVVSFYTNAGLVGSSGVTNAAGVASVYFKGPGFSGTSKVLAVADQGTASLNIESRASSATRIQLSVSPDNIGVNGGIANLAAMVYDAQGNTVTGQTIGFRLLRGPGGGEAISQPISISQLGKASSSLSAGTIPSNYRAVLVEASIAGGPSDTVELTISGLPYLVTISRPQDDTVVVAKAGTMDSTVFQYFVGAVVQDVNGNPVADGTVVHFGAAVSGMVVHARYLVEWAGVNGATELKAVLGYRSVDVPFEDMNDNKIMDVGTDLTLDYNNSVARRGDDVNGDGLMDYDPTTHDYWVDFNGNGRCDPLVGEPRYDSIVYPNVYADLDRNGFYSPSELVNDLDGDGLCDLSASGDFSYSLWEMYPQWAGKRFNFATNEFAIAIAVSATTIKGVAQTALTYPRQFANRLMATVNAEANGIRDRDAERFVLPVIIEK
jgi:hypothetical protein